MAAHHAGLPRTGRPPQYNEIGRYTEIIDNQQALNTNMHSRLDQLTNLVDPSRTAALAQAKAQEASHAASEAQRYQQHAQRSAQEAQNVLQASTDLQQVRALLQRMEEMEARLDAKLDRIAENQGCCTVS
jgi:multidrug resistance efflux pump